MPVSLPCPGATGFAATSETGAPPRASVEMPPPLAVVPLADVEQLLHHRMQRAGPGAGAEGVVQGAVDLVQFGIDGVVFGDGVEDLVAGGGHGGLQGGEVARTGCGGTKDGGTQGAGLLAAADLHGAAQHVGIDLHEGFVLDRQAAGVDDLKHGHAVLFDAVDDGERAEGRGLDVGAVDCMRLGV